MRLRHEPGGIHVFDRATGLHILFDEVRTREDAWARVPRFLSIALTNACELHCPYCFAPKHGARLPYNSILHWLHEFDTQGGLGVGFGGGEPTLYPQFAELCHEVTTNTGLSVSFTTHGHWSNKGLGDRLRGSVNFIRLSMDGLYGTYEKLRGRSFQQFILALNRVRDTSQFGINFVVNDETVDQLEQAADFAIENGALEFLLLPEMPTPKRTGPSPSTKSSFETWVQQNWMKYPLRTSDTSIGHFDFPTVQAGDGRFAMDFAHIDASGRLKGCAFDGDGIALDTHQTLTEALAVLTHARPTSINEGDAP
jgi:MoaA/NifB/PqqE/SkfB family radical SAM enzyme